jgi:formylglycine-generating enzyme required for sulfatase activity
MQFDFAIEEQHPSGFTEGGTCSAMCPHIALDNKSLGQVIRNSSLDSPAASRVGFSYSYIIDLADWGTITKMVPIAISWTDSAGNTMEEVLPAVLSLDFAPPQASFCSLSPDQGNAATVFSYTVTVAEPLDGIPKLDVQSINQGLFGTPPSASNDGLSFTWHQPVIGLQAEEFSLSATLTDVSGNESDGPVCSRSAWMDGASPGIGGGELSVSPEVLNSQGESTLTVGDGARIIATFQVSEDTALAPDSPEVQFVTPGQTFSFFQESAQQTEDGLWHYTYVLDITRTEFIGSEGLWPVRGSVEDTTGNLMVDENLGGMPVHLDLTPPSASCILAPAPNAGPYGLSASPTLQISPLEELEVGFVPDVIEDFTPPLQAPFFTWLDQSTYTFTSAVEPATGESDFFLRVRLRDLAGNETPAEGNACSAGIITGSVDGLAPEVTAIEISSFDDEQKVEAGTPLKAGVKIVADLQVFGTEQEPVVFVGSSQMEKVSGGETGPDDNATPWQFQHLLDGNEGQGLRSLSVSGADAVGNPYTHLLSDAVEFDFLPPFVLSANLFLTAPADSVVKQVTGATNGTTLQLIVTANEPLWSPPVVEASNGSRTIHWGAPSEANAATATYTWTLMLEEIGHETNWQGQYEVTALLTDLAGNESAPVLALASPLTVDTIAPPDIDDSYQRGLRLYRNPHGSQETGLAPLTEVRGCGATGNSDPLWSWCPPPGTFTPVDCSTTVTLYEMTGEGDEGCSSLVIEKSKLGENEGGDGFAIALNADRAGVCMSRTDASGNASPVRQIRYVEWVGGLRDNSAQNPGGNPNKLYTFSAFANTEWPRLGTDLLMVMEGEDLQGVISGGDGKAASNSALPGWRDISRGADQPQLETSSMAFDAWRGRALLFGGSQAGNATNGTYEWNGFGWTKLCPSHAPSPRFGNSMAYDSVRGKVVLFGGESWNGQSLSLSDETWEWDGMNWTQRIPEHVPPPSTGHDMAFNPVTGRVMMMGGTSQSPLPTRTWEWTGEDWTLLWQAPDGEELKSRMKLLYHPELAAMILYADTNQGTRFLKWTGTDWTPLELAAEASLLDSIITVDPSTGKAWLVEQNGAWVLEENGWEPQPDVDLPSSLSVVTAFTDYAMGEAGLVYGQGNTTVGANGTWLVQIPNGYPQLPPYVMGSPLTYDPGNHQLRLVSKGCGGDLFWSGRFWHNNGNYDYSIPATPGAFIEAGIAYDYGQDKLIGFGKSNGENGHLWNTWVQGTEGSKWAFYPGPTPEPEVDFGLNSTLVSHAASLQTLYMEPLFRQWVWTGLEAQWNYNVPDYAPVAGFGAAYDSLRERVVANASDMGTWFWDGRNWTWPRAGDVAGSFHLLPDYGGMTYDAARDRVVFHGMDPDMPVGTWEFDGEHWHKAELRSDLPAQPAYMAQYPPTATAVATGLTGFSPEDDTIHIYMETWTYSPASSRPHLIAAFDLEAASAVPTLDDPEGKMLMAIEVTATAGGLSHTMGSGRFDGEATAGAELSVFTTNPAPWVPIAALPSATPDNPATTLSTFDRNWRCSEGPFCPGSSIDRWVAPDGRLYIDATTTEGHGATDTPAEIALDLLEMRLIYYRGTAVLDEAPPCIEGQRRCEGLVLSECSPSPTPNDNTLTYTGGQDCNDGNPCTADDCSPSSGCTNSDVAAPCEPSQTACSGRLLLHCEDWGGCAIWGEAEECPQFSTCKLEDGTAACHCIHLACDNECCPGPTPTTEFVCHQGNCCLSQCDGNACGGNDGCGGLCGCDLGLECVDGSCQLMECSPFVQSACATGTWCSADDHKCHPEDCDNEMCTIPGGIFWRGCNPQWDLLCAPRSHIFEDPEIERPNVWVQVDGFRIDRFEVTVERYAACYDAGECEMHFDDWDNTDGLTWDQPGFEKHPVNYASWFSAQTFCAWEDKRLCTDSEWEKAARGADGRVYPWGNNCSPNEWNVSCSAKDVPPTWEMGITTSDVGQHPDGRSPYGVHNMAGNVCEWVGDVFDRYYGFSPDSLDNPQGPAPNPYDTEETRRVRGGSVHQWWDKIDQMRTTYGRAERPDYRGRHIGFRCCQDLLVDP